MITVLEIGGNSFVEIENGKYEGIKNFAFYNGENSKEAVSYISRVDKSAGRRDVNDLMRVYYVLIFNICIYDLCV